MSTRATKHVRNGVADGFICFAPPLCERHARVTRSGTKVDLAEMLRCVGRAVTQTETIVLVWDKLNTHSMGSPCEAFPPGKAERLARHFGVHCTPRHGSWLDMAEVEIGCLIRHGLPVRVADYETFKRLVAS